MDLIICFHLYWFTSILWLTIDIIEKKTKDLGLKNIKSYLIFLVFYTCPIVWADD